MVTESRYEQRLLSERRRRGRSQEKARSVVGRGGPQLKTMEGSRQAVVVDL
jgi:hypothetical protein